MYYNLNNKKQRKQFWKDCEKAVSKCTDFDLEYHSWENWKKISPIETMDFWNNNVDLWNTQEFINNLSKNAVDTFDYYDGLGIEELNSFGDD
jgi:hypothetical protein